MLDRAEVKTIMAEIDAAMKIIADRHKLTVKPVRGSFNSAELGIRATFQAVGDDGENIVEKKQWNKYATMFGLKPEDFGRVVTIRGEDFRLVSLDAKRKKYPFVCERLRDHKRYKLDAWTIRMVTGLPSGTAEGLNHEAGEASIPSV